MPAIPRSLAVFLAVSAGAVQPPPLDRFIATKVTEYFAAGSPVTVG